MTTKQIHQENRRLQGIKSALLKNYASSFEQCNKGMRGGETLVLLRHEIENVSIRIEENWAKHGGEA